MRLPQARVLAVVVAAACLATSLGHRAGAVPMAATARTVQVTATTANIRVTLDGPAVRHDVRRATSGTTSVVAFQEMWHRRAARLLPPGWAAFQTGRPVPACRGNAIAWDRHVWRLVRARAVVIHRSTLASGTRCATVAILRHRATGLRLPVVGVHMLPHVDLAGHPRDLPRRIRVYWRGMANLVDVLHQLRVRYGRAIVGGDWNVDWPADRRVQFPGFPYAHLHVRWNSNWGRLPWTRPTHGNRRIDTWWWSERSGIRAVDSDTLGRTRSDHNFVRLTFRTLVP